MRLVIWNCHQALHRKHNDLMSLAPDIAIISECANPNSPRLKKELLKSSLGDSAWTGINSNKGLGIFTYNDFKIRKDSVQDVVGKFNIKADISNTNSEVRVLGMWTQGPGYVEEAHKTVDFYLGDLRNRDIILAGDLNSNQIWDGKHAPNHTGLVTKLKRELNLVSVYHNLFNETHGKESNGTLFFQYNECRPYYIDYIFIPEKWISRIKSFEVGKFKDWRHLSDHCPVVLELDL